MFLEKEMKSDDNSITGVIKAENKANDENLTFRYFTALGIIFIVCGHLGCDIFTLGNLFPYYSFHVYIFLFVTGYFYRKEDEKTPFIFMRRKAKKLLLPYFVFNCLYGLLSGFLNYKGIYLGGGISLFNLFAAPFLGGHQFMFNSPAWFVPALFVTELIFLFARKGLVILLGWKIKEESDREKPADLILLAVFLSLGVLMVYLAIGGHIWGSFRKTIGRWIIMLPGISLGQVYRSYIELFIKGVKNKAVNLLGNIKGNMVFYSALYALAVGTAIILKINCGGLNFSVVWCTGFANGPIVPFISVLAGLTFWLLTANILSRLEFMKLLKYIGRASYSVMTHHFLLLFLINLFFFVARKRGLQFVSSSPFDMESFFGSITYQYMYAGKYTPFLNSVLLVGIITLIDCLVSRMRILRK